MQEATATMGEHAEERTPDTGQSAGYLTAREAATRLGINERTIRRAIARGDLPATKGSGVYRIARSALVSFQARDRTRTPPSALTANFPPRLVPPPPRDHAVPLPQSLPLPVTSFVGREREVAEVGDLLRGGVRLLTLTGPGGVGKTRLALAVAAELAADITEGVTFVPLAQIRDPARVLPTVARALGVRMDSDRPIAARLAAILQDRDLLLVLDNLEQVVEAAPEVAEILVACPTLRVLVTSRTRLRVSGEHAFPVPPLALPAAGGVLAAEEAARNEAIALFVARAWAADPEFALTESNAASVVAICHRLDGLPLAIELAAARASVLSPPAILAHLNHRLTLLSGGGRDQPPRLRSLRETITWSYDLLAPGEQALFRRLAVFEGGCTLEAAEAVCTDLDVDVLDGMTALVHQSLLRRVEQSAGAPRFGMLETVREFALERLAASGGEPTVRAAHAVYCAALVERMRVGFSASTTTVARLVEAERSNLRAALDWEADRDSSDLLLRLVDAEWWLFWEPAEVVRWLEQGVAATAHMPPARRGQRALLLAATAQCAVWRSDFVRAAELLGEGLVLGREAGEARAIALAVQCLGAVALGQGDLDRALALVTEALSRWRMLPGPNWGTGEALYFLGIITHLRGEPERSEVLFAEALAMGRALGLDWQVAAALEALGTCARERGDQRRAAALFAESLALIRDGTVPFVMVNCIKSLGAVAAVVGEAEQAARLLGAAAAWRERFGFGWTASEPARFERAIAPARARLPESTFATAWAAGQALPLDRALAEALAVAKDVTKAVPEAHPVPAGLTARELEVLRLIATGKTDREIAAALSISRRTAEWHTCNVLGKLGVANRTAAASRAARENLLPSSSP